MDDDPESDDGDEWYNSKLPDEEAIETERSKQLQWEKEHNDDCDRASPTMLERLEYVETEMQQLKDQNREEVREYDCIQERQTERQEEWRQENHPTRKENKETQDQNKPNNTPKDRHAELWPPKAARRAPEYHLHNATLHSES